MGLERCIPLSFAASSAGRFSGSTPIIDSELGLKPVSGHYPAFHLPEVTHARRPNDFFGLL
jgi:hypothetical protein